MRIGQMEIPHKLVYLDGGGQAWRAVCEDPRYDLGRRELVALARLMNHAAPWLPRGHANVVHLGPGTGREVATVVDALGPANIRQYGVVDISANLLGMAGAVVAGRLGPDRARQFRHDLSGPGLAAITRTLRHDGASFNVLMLAGNGGILSELTCLVRIGEAMAAEDRLVLTLEYYQPEREQAILDQFRLPPILNLFGRSLAPLGIRDPRPEEFDLLYNPEAALLEVYFVPGPSRHVPHMPDRLRVFASFRPTPEKLRTTLESCNLRVLSLDTFAEEHCCGAVCCISEGGTAR